MNKCEYLLVVLDNLREENLDIPKRDRNILKQINHLKNKVMEDQKDGKIRADTINDIESLIVKSIENEYEYKRGFLGIRISLLRNDIKSITNDVNLQNLDEEIRGRCEPIQDIIENLKDGIRDTYKFQQNKINERLDKFRLNLN